MPSPDLDLPPPFDAASRPDDSRPDEAFREELDRAFRAASAEADDPAELVDLGTRAFAAGDLVSAVLALRSAWGRSPDHAAGIRLVAAEIRLGLLGAAEARADALLDADETGYASLQLGNAARYRGRHELAQARFEAAREGAEARKDAALAVAADCGMGELMLDRDEPRSAVRWFGRALGLTELAPDDAVTVAPLAGLAQAHAAWRAPAKAERLAQRALDRAAAAGDAPGRARVLLALATGFGRADDVEAAIAAALAAPHVPFWVRAHAVRAAADPSSAQNEDTLQRAHRVAAWAGMEPEMQRLEPTP